MNIYETELTDDIMNTLIFMSEQWEQENSCHGYRKNTIDDIIGNRVFIAVIDNTIVGYLFGHKEITDKETSIYTKNEEFFDVSELYVKPEYRNQDIGKQLFRYVEQQIKDEVKLIMLATATKNFRSILHFYIDELGMEFWSAALYKRI